MEPTPKTWANGVRSSEGAFSYIERLAAWQAKVERLVLTKDPSDTNEQAPSIQFLLAHLQHPMVDCLLFSPNHDALLLSRLTPHHDHDRLRPV